MAWQFFVFAYLKFYSPILDPSYVAKIKEKETFPEAPFIAFKRKQCAKVGHPVGCESDLFSLKCDCDFSYCNGDMKDFKKMWESSPSYKSTSEETRCLLKAYYVAYPTTTEAPSTTTETTSEMPNTTTDSEEQMGKLQYSRKSWQNPQVEKQIDRKRYYKEEKEEEKAAERADTIMIIIFVCLCVIFVALVVLAIILVLTGPKDPMTKRKVRGKHEKKKRKK